VFPVAVSSALRGSLITRVTVAPVFVAAALVFAACRSSRVDPINAKVDALFAEWNRADSPGCSAGVGREGAVVYEHGYGTANLELGVRITPESVFPAASISKQFTAMSILLLVQRGQVRLDDEVRKYVTELPNYGSPITIRHLLNHTSGLRDGFNLDGWSAPRPDGSDPNDAILRVVVRQRGLNFAPGSQFQYNNGAYNLLGSIVKRVSGQSLRAFADSHIFKPLGMTQTHFHDDPAMIVPGRVSNYWRDSRGWQVGSEVPGIIGNAGLYTTASDLLRWSHNFDDIRVGDAALLAAAQTPAVLTSGEKSLYGFGVSIGEYRGLRAITHGGGDRGISTYLLRLPDAKLAVAVLCNSDSIPAQMLAERVAELYLSDRMQAPAAGGKPTPVAEVKLSERELARYAGWYRDPSHGGVLRLFMRDGRLTISDVEGDDIPFELTPAGGGRFFILLSGVPMNRLEFLSEPDGSARELHMFPAGIESTPQVFHRTRAVASPKDLSTFAGSYQSEELDVTYLVVANGAGLMMRPPGRPEMALELLEPDQFIGSIAGLVKFSRDSRGQITGFTMSRRLARGVQFDRVKTATS
jgi:CubicO group peptidase (beta-lactamase class C family)